MGGRGSECSDRGKVRVLGSTITLLAFALTLSRSTSTALPMRLLLVGGTGGGRGLLLTLLLVTLLGKARVTALAFHSGNLLRSLRSLMLPAVSLGLKLTYDLTSDIIKLQVSDSDSSTDDGNKILPFSRESGQRNECLQLRRYGKGGLVDTSTNCDCTKTSKGRSHFLELGSGMLVRIEANGDRLFEIFVDAGHRDRTIPILDSIPENLGGIAGDGLLNGGGEAKGEITPSHLIVLVPQGNVSGSDWRWSKTNHRYCDCSCNISPESLRHKEGGHRLRPSAPVGAVKDGYKGGELRRHNICEAYKTSVLL